MKPHFTPATVAKAVVSTVAESLAVSKNTPLSAMAAEDPDVPVLVRGDERLDYGSVMNVVQVVYKCKVRRMALVTVEK